MSSELLSKLEEKLGSAIDLFTFENTKALVAYIQRYLIVKQSIILAFFSLLLILSILGLIKSLTDFEWDGTFFGFAIMVIFIMVLFVYFLFNLVAAIYFPEIAIINWLR